MDEPIRNMRYVLLVSLFFIGINGQFSLDELVNKYKNEHGYVNPASNNNPHIENIHFQQSQNNVQDPRYNSQVSNALANCIFDLGRNIGQNIAQTSNTKAQVFSPTSIAGALLIVLLGSNGQTFHELFKLFNFDRNPLLVSNPFKIHEEFGLLLEDFLSDHPNPMRYRPLSPWKYMVDNEHRRHSNPGDDTVITNIANGVFLQNGFSLRPDFKSAVESIYKAKIASFDFVHDGTNAANYINEWVDYETHGKIKNILAGAIDTQTKMIIVSALYFKATWEKSFFEGATNLRDFFPDGVNKPAIQVQMMANGGVFPFYDSQEYDCRILGFPYKQNLTTMYIILPNDSNRQKLRETQAYLTAEKINDMISKMQLKTSVILFPKLHIENSLNLPNVLSALGVRSLFNSGESDLSLISTGLVENFNGLNFGQINPQFVPSSVNSDRRNYIQFPNNQTRVQPLMRQKRQVKYKVESSFRRTSEPLRLKDFILNKKITKVNPGKKLHRNRRQVDLSSNIKNLDILRNTQTLTNPKIFASDILHKIDLSIDERGTEGGAATVVHLTRTGTDVVFRVDTPFLLLITHDATKLPLFYGAVYEPTNF